MPVAFYFLIKLLNLKKVLIILFILACLSAALAQQCSFYFKGTVSSADNQMLESVSLELSPGKKGTITNSEGAFEFSDLCAGRYVLIIRHIGFEPLVDSIAVVKNLEKSYILISKNQELEAVVIHEESHQDGITISGLNRTELDAVAGKSLGETLKEIPGVASIQAGPGVSKPVIHGVHGQRILILNNGVRMEGQQWGAEHAPEIDPFIASEIRVIKDASSIRHGVDAIGGVVVVNPPELPETTGLGGYFQTIGQSNGRSGIISGSLQGGIGGAKGWGWRIQGTGKKAGDYRAAKYFLTNTGLRENNFSGAVGYHNQRGGLEIFASRFNTAIGILSGSVSSSVGDLADAISAEAPRYTRDFSYSIANPRQAVNHQLIKLNAHLAGEKGTWRWLYAWQQNKRKEYDVRRSGLSELPAIDLVLDTHTMEGEWEQQDNGNMHLRFGANGMVQMNKNVFGTQRIPFIPDYTTLTGGLYSVINIESETWKMDAGVRYDLRTYDVAGYDFKNTLYRQRMTFHNVSATAGISFERPGNQILTTSLSSAWRPPHVAELFSLGTHQSAAAIEYGLFLDPATNEVRDESEVDFKSEQSLKWVGGWKKMDEQLTAEVTAYANLIFNYFYLRPGGITRNIRGAYPFFRYAQTNALFAGLDMESTWKPTDKMSIHPRASLIYAKDISNQDYLVFIPANRVELNVRKNLTSGESLQQSFFEVRARYVFRQFRAPQVIRPEAFLNEVSPIQTSNRIFDFMAAPEGYFLAGASAGFSIASSSIRYDFRLTAENLLNAAYRDYTNRFRYYADELGRNIIFSIKMTF